MLNNNLYCNTQVTTHATNKTINIKVILFTNKSQKLRFKLNFRSSIDAQLLHITSQLDKLSINQRYVKVLRNVFYWKTRLSI